MRAGKDERSLLWQVGGQARGKVEMGWVGGMKGWNGVKERVMKQDMQGVSDTVGGGDKKYVISK